MTRRTRPRAGSALYTHDLIDTCPDAAVTFRIRHFLPNKTPTIRRGEVMVYGLDLDLFRKKARLRPTAEWVTCRSR
jgi:hypothetical protein